MVCCELSSILYLSQKKLFKVMKLLHFGKENAIVCKMMECQNVSLSEVKGKGTNAPAWSWWKSLKCDWTQSLEKLDFFPPEAASAIPVICTIIAIFRLPFEVEWLLLWRLKTWSRSPVEPKWFPDWLEFYLDCDLNENIQKIASNSLFLHIHFLHWGWVFDSIAVPYESTTLQKVLMAWF